MNRDAGRGSFEDGHPARLERLLADPNFLFRIERVPPNLTPATVYRISDIELASRLSFFLWSSIPDDELLDLATRDKLRDPQVLETAGAAHARRSPRGGARRQFRGTVAVLAQLQTNIPDADVFPDFDDNLREAFYQETELFIESSRSEDRSVPELFSADYTFVNERLARHYGIKNIYGNHFRRVRNQRRAGAAGCSAQEVC